MQDLVVWDPLDPKRPEWANPQTECGHELAEGGRGCEGDGADSSWGRGLLGGLRLLGNQNTLANVLTAPKSGFPKGQMGWRVS